MTYTGTVLGGPHDGRVLTMPSPRLVLPDPMPFSPQIFGLDQAVLPSDIWLRETHYRWAQDDDGRGWWVTERALREGGR